MAVCYSTGLSEAIVTLRAVAQSWGQPFCLSQGMLNGPHVPVLFRVLRQRPVSLLAQLAVYGARSGESLLGSLTITNLPTLPLGHSMSSGTPFFPCVLGS